MNDPTGIRTLGVSPEKTAPIESAGHKSGNIGAPSGDPTGPATPTDPDLSAVIAAWHTLPPALRAGIAAMVRAAARGEGDR